MVASQPMFRRDGGCARGVVMLQSTLIAFTACKECRSCPGTGIEKQDETGNKKCQNNIFKFIFMANRIDLIMKFQKFIFYR